MCAKLARFYGWEADVIDEMDAITAVKYSEAITVLEAQEVLMQLRIIDFPQMKKSARNAFHRKMVSMAYPKTFDPNRKAITTVELADRMRAMLNG